MNSSTRRNPWTLVFAAVAVVLIGCAVGVTRSVPRRCRWSRVRRRRNPSAQGRAIVGGPRLPHDKHAELGRRVHRLPRARRCRQRRLSRARTSAWTATGPRGGGRGPGGAADRQRLLHARGQAPLAEGDPGLRRGPEVLARAARAAKVACAECHGTMAGTQRQAQASTTWRAACSATRSAARATPARPATGRPGRTSRPPTTRSPGRPATAPPSGARRPAAWSPPATTATRSPPSATTATSSSCPPPTTSVGSWATAAGALGRRPGRGALHVLPPGPVVLRRLPHDARSPAATSTCGCAGTA